MILCLPANPEAPTMIEPRVGDGLDDPMLWCYLPGGYNPTSSFRQERYRLKHNISRTRRRGTSSELWVKDHVMGHDRTLEDLWNTALPSEQLFDPTSVDHLPPVAQRYLRHALAPGAKLSTCARLTMTGTIKLKSGWCQFDAEQVLRWDRGFVWAAKAWTNGLPVSGFDRLVDGAGAMHWKLLGLFTVMKAEGVDIARAAAGRLHAEAIWLPAVLLKTDVAWADRGDNHSVAIFDAHGEHSELDLEISPEGAVLSCRLSRWGDMNAGDFAYHPFGGTSNQERTFWGVTIPVHLRVGWLFGTPAFATEGEFFRCTLDTVEFR